MLYEKEKFFKQALVPSAQLIEMACRPSYALGVFKRRDKCLYTFYDVANLVVCYVLHPTTPPVALTVLWAEAFQPVMADMLHLHSQLPKYSTRNSDSVVTKIGFYTRLQAALEKFSSKLRTQMGFTPEKRNLWLQLYTGDEAGVERENPRFEGGRINRWRTFVHNTQTAELETCFHRFNKVFDSGELKAVRKQGLSDRTLAMAQARALWATMFATPEVPLTEGSTAVLTTESGPEKRPVSVILPATLTVQAVTSTRLRVVAKHVSPALNSLSAAERLESAYITILRQFQFSEECSITELEQTVENAAQWSDAHVKSEMTYRALANSIKEAVQVKNILERFKKTFTAGEQRLFLTAVSEGKLQVRA